MTKNPPRERRVLPRRTGARALPLLRGIRREDPWLAAAYFAVFWLLNAVSMGGSTGFDAPWVGTHWYVFAALGCVAVVFRRTATAAMAVICGISALVLILGNQPTALVLVFELFFSLVLFGSPKVSAAASRSAVGLSLLLTLVVLAWTRAAEPTIVAASVAVMALLMPVEWAGNVRKANQLAESEAARANAVQDAAAQRLLAERSSHDLALEQERQHMARELHDVISARLSAIALQSGAALHAAKDGPGIALLRQIRQESVSGLEELNAMIRLLHTGALAEAPGRLGDLASLVARYRSAGVQLTFTDSMHDAGTWLPLPAQTAVYRIAAEALANAARHAPGSPVDITLSLAPPEWRSGDEAAGQALALTVTSALSKDTHGAAAGSGTGIPSMHFRAAHAGGVLTARPHGTDWRVVLRLPLETSHAAASMAEQRMDSTDGCIA